MKSSRAIILSILIILAFSLNLGAISAQAIDDDSTCMMIDVDEETEDIGNIDSLSSNDNSLDDVDGPDIISAANDEISISDDGEDNTSDIGTFYELRTSIRNSESNFTLEKDYNFTSSSTSGITIDKDFTINGNGHYIDSQGLSRIFNIQVILHLTLKEELFLHGIPIWSLKTAVLIHSVLILVEPSVPLILI